MLLADKSMKLSFCGRLKVGNMRGEWRLIGQRGLQNSPLELEEVIFGMRCDDPVKYAVMKALECREPKVKFYQMQEMIETFEIEKCALKVDDELLSHFPR